MSDEPNVVYESDRMRVDAVGYVSVKNAAGQWIELDEDYQLTLGMAEELARLAARVAHLEQVASELTPGKAAEEIAKGITAQYMDGYEDGYRAGAEACAEAVDLDLLDDDGRLRSAGDMRNAAISACREIARRGPEESDG